MWHGKEAFEHNNPRDKFCLLQLFLNHFTAEIYSDNHLDFAFANSTN